jgi:Stringent starvation protein B
MNKPRSRRSYLISAIHEWASDHGYTPHLVVAADAPGVQVPVGFVRDGRIVLNVAYNAVKGFDPTAEPLFFSARFGGMAQEIVVPTGAVLAVYAAENGEGIAFGETESEPEPPSGPESEPEAPSTEKRPAGRSHLRVVK